MFLDASNCPWIERSHPWLHRQLCQVCHVTLIDSCHIAGLPWHAVLGDRVVGFTVIVDQALQINNAIQAGHGVDVRLGSQSGQTAKPAFCTQAYIDVHIAVKR